MDEKTFRKHLEQTLDEIDRAFHDVDPDLAESNPSQGALTITMSNGQKLILSPQPFPKQLWIAFRDQAWHFDWNEARQCWLDDRGRNIEALGLVADLTRQASGVDVFFRPATVSSGP